MTLVTSIAKTLGQLQDKPVLYPLVKEVAGCNVPKSLVVRNRDEMIDVATGQFGGTICFFGSGLLLDKLLKPVFDKVLSKPNLLLNPKAAMEWARLGKSFSIYALQGALYWAVPFFRNYLTLKRSKTHNFVQMVGASKKSQANEKKLQEKQKYYTTMVGKIVAGGFAASLLSTLGAIAAIKKGLPITKPVAFVLKHLGLGGGSFINYPRWAEFFFIAVASYVGWIHATRDKYELKEQLLQFGTFLFGWFVPPIAMERIFKGQLRKKLNNETLFNKVIGVNAQGKPNSMLNLKNIEKFLANKPALRESAKTLFVAQTMLGLGISIILLSTLPQLLNIRLTQIRAQKSRLKEQAAQEAKLKVPEIPPPQPLVQPVQSAPVSFQPQPTPMPMFQQPNPYQLNYSYYPQYQNQYAATQR